MAGRGIPGMASPIVLAHSPVRVTQPSPRPLPSPFLVSARRQYAARIEECCMSGLAQLGEALLAAVPVDGSSIGNQTLFERLKAQLPEISEEQLWACLLYTSRCV